MGTQLLESALAEMFPPNLTIHRQGWVWRNGPVQINYMLGYDEVGRPYMRDLATGLTLESTPMDSAEDLARNPTRMNSAPLRMTVPVYGIWLLRRGRESDPNATVEVYAETDNGWRLIATEPVSANFSHEVTALGIENSPIKEPVE